MRKRKLIIGLLILKLALFFFFMSLDNDSEKDDSAISPEVKLKEIPLEKKLGVEPSETTSDLTPAPIYQGKPNINKVSFICNVAWGTEYIDELIVVLDKHEVKISFFLEGRWAKNNPQKTKFIFDKGHEIGNHAYSHYNMSTIDRDLIKEEINKTSKTIESIIDEEVKLFGPPAGDFDDRVLEVADDLGLYTIMWSLDTIDWMEPGIDYMTDKILDGIHPGAFILMHPTEDTVTALDEILSGLKEKSYKVVPVSEQLGVDVYENQVFFSFP